MQTTLLTLESFCVICCDTQEIVKP